MARANANREPQTTLTEKPVLILRRKELPLEHGQVLRSVENLMDAGNVHAMNETPEYRVADLLPDGPSHPLFYHGRNIEPPVPRESTGELRWPSDSHVKNLEKLVEIYRAAVALRRQQHPELEQPDPLGLEERAYAFFEDLENKVQQNGRLQDEQRAVAAWNAMSDDERRRAIDAAIFWVTPQHDLGNLIDGVKNWKILLHPPVTADDDDMKRQLAENVTFLKQQRYKRAEETEAAMFRSFVDDVKGEFDWSDSFASVVRALGAEMILRTEFEFNWVRPGEDPHRAMITLAILDQVASMLNASGLRGVVGLVNEMRVRALQPLPGDELTGDNMRSFDPNVFCGGFVLSRFEKLDNALGKEKGTSFREYVAFLDEYRIAKPDEFARILSVPVESVKRIKNFEQFLRDRMSMQQEASRIFWPPEARENNGRVRFEDAFKNWGKEEFERMERICRVYQMNFWKPDYTVEAFKSEISKT